MQYISRNSHFCAALALICALTVCMGSLTAYAQTCDTVRSEVLRLHVIANSDSTQDQNIKLLVRDRLLSVGAEHFSQAESVVQAAEITQSVTDDLTREANAVLAENGVDYKAKVTLKKEYFETRTYEDVTLPAGVYLAVCVVLGEGQGKNWWCVMFPPLCIPAVTKQDSEYAVFEDGNETVLSAEDGYVIRFKVVELFEQWRQYIRERQNKKD